MKYISLFSLLICSFFAQAQYDSTKILQKQNAYGYEWKNMKIDGSIIFPSDTPRMAIADTGTIVIIKGTAWTWKLNHTINILRWEQLGGNVSKINDTTFLIGTDTMKIISNGGGAPFYDSTLMASVKRLKDSLAAVRNTINNNLIPPGNDQDIFFNDGGVRNAVDGLTFNKVFREACIGCDIAIGDAEINGGGASHGGLRISPQNGSLTLGGDTITEAATSGTNHMLRFLTGNTERIKVDNTGSITLPTLTSNSDTTTHKPLVYNTFTKEATYLDHWPGVSNDSNVIVNTVQQLGTIFSDNFARSSLGGNYTATGGTYSFPSSLYLQMTGGDGTFNNYIIRNQTISTHQHTDTVMFIPTVKNGTSFGVSTGVQSWQPGTKRDLLAQFSVSTSTLVGNITIYGQPDYPTAILAQSSSLSFSALDTLLGISQRNDNTINATFKNITTGASVTCTYTYPTSNVSGYLLHNTGNPILYNNGGTNNIIFWKVVNNQSKTNDVIIGNSLVSYDASSSITSWPNLLYNARSDYSVICGPGDRTANAITQLGDLSLYAPKKIFIDLGINDFLGGVSAATFSTQYDSLCHSAKNMNVPVYLLSLSPTTSSVVAFNDTIKLKAIKYGFTYIDIYSWLKSGTGTTLSSIYDGGDGLHWNDAAHSLVASLLQPYRNRYSNNLSSGNVFTLTTNTTSGASSYGGGILNIPQYAGLSSSLTSGRFAISTASNSIADYAELTWDNTAKRVNFNGTFQVGDNTLTHAGYNTIGVGGSGKGGAVDFYDGADFIGEYYTTPFDLNLFTNTTLPLNFYTNGATSTPNIQAFEQHVGINSEIGDSTVFIAGGLELTGGIKLPILASVNASPSQSGARVALNIDAHGILGTYVPSLENILANGSDLSNSYTTLFGSNDWIMSQNGAGRFKINGLRTASGTYTVLTKNADSSQTQISLSALAAAIGATAISVGAIDSLSKAINGAQVASNGRFIGQTADATHTGYEDTATYKLIDSLKNRSLDSAHPYVLRTGTEFATGGARFDSLYVIPDTMSARLGISNRTVFTQTAFQTIANSTTETTIIGTGIGSNVFSANYFTVGKTIVIKGFGKISTALVPGNLTYKFLNSSSGPTVTLTPGNSLSNIPVEYEFTGTVTAIGNISTGLITLAGWFSVNGVKSYFAPDTFAFDTTTGQTFTVNIIWSTASTSNSITGTNCVTEIKK